MPVVIDIGMLFVKGTIAFLFFLVGRSLVGAWLYARQRHMSVEAIPEHQNLARLTLIVTLLAVGLTEYMVRMNGGVQDKELFWLHLAFAAPFLILLITLQWFTGLKAPGAHKALGYTVMATYLGTAITGGILLWNA